LSPPLRLVVDNAETTREALVARAVRGAADACHPWGVFNLGMGETLQRILEGDNTALTQFLADVRLAFKIQGFVDDVERAGAGGIR